VDAIYRLLLPLPISFRQDPPIVLDRGRWCPFNSQNTTTFPEAYPLLYLPACCSFRMTDIWRSFVAQRILWTCDWRVSFHASSVWQDRNDHDLLRDFADEVPGYLHNARIAEVLSALDLPAGEKNIPANLTRCYASLVELGVVAREELALLAAWLADLGSLDGLGKTSQAQTS
jgi:STELLO glycosyltransferases